MLNGRYDAIIVGAGVCGALIAWQLAKTRARVLLLEAGPGVGERLPLVAKYAGAAAKTPGAPYADPQNDKFAPTEDTSPGYYVKSSPQAFKSTYVRRAGGSTWHFLGNTPRFLPRDFELHRHYQQGFDWPLTYAELEPFYCDAETFLGVSGDHETWNNESLGFRSKRFPMSQIWESYGDRVVKKRLEGLVIDGVPVSLLSTPQARNSRPYDGRPACAGNSSCVPLCPIQAKYDATIHLAKAIAEGADFQPKAVVFKLDSSFGTSTIDRVHYVDWEGQRHTAMGKVVVVAAHAIETAKLLLMSGVANSSGQVGRNLMDHLQGAVVCIAPEPVFPFRGPPTTSGVDVFRDGPFRSESAAFRLSLGNDGWGRSEAPETRVEKLVEETRLHGRKLREEIEKRFVRLLRLSYSTEMLPNENNRVELDATVDAHGLPKPRITFGITDYSRRGFKHAQDVCTKIFEKVGGSEIQVIYARDHGIPQDDQFSGAGHILGTCRMGNDPSKSVVDPWCRTHDHPNLFVVGSTVFPTSGTANPTLTAAALSLRSISAVQRTIGETNP